MHHLGRSGRPRSRRERSGKAGVRGGGARSAPLTTEGVNAATTPSGEYWAELISIHQLIHELTSASASAAQFGASYGDLYPRNRPRGHRRPNYGSERHDCEAAAWPPVAALRVARAQGRVPRELPTKTSATNVGPSMHDRSSGLAALLVVIVYQTFGGEGGGMS